MTDASDLDRRLAALECTVRRQRTALGSLALILGVLGLASWRASDPEELRAQRFVALDERGNVIGDFGFQRHEGVAAVGWSLNDPDTGARASCFVGRDQEEGVAQDKGVAGLQLEAGWAISQHFVREQDTTVSHSYVIGEDEKTAARLTATATSSELVLSPLPHGETMLDERDETHALRLSYDAGGPSITGNDLEGASKIDIR